MKTTLQYLLIILFPTYPYLSCRPLFLHVNDEPNMVAYIPAVQTLANPCLDLMHLSHSWSLCHDEICEDKKPIRIALPILDPLILHYQDVHKPPPNGPQRRCLSSGQLGGKLAPATLPYGIVCNTPVQVRPIVFAGVVYVYLQQQLIVHVRRKALGIRS